MHTHAANSRHTGIIVALALVISSLLVFATQAAEIHYGLNIWDEGFLW